ncbi:MAG: RDD family protein [Gemmatimonadaceae bacterium]
MTSAAVPATGGPAVFASLGARFFASMVDLVVIAVPSLVVSRLLAHAPGRIGDAVVTALVSCYFIASFGSPGGGRSVGKFVAGIRVVDANGGALSFGAATIRWFMSIGIALPLAFLAVGFERGLPLQTGPAFAICVPILCVVVIDSYMCVAHRVSHRSLHDLAAGSYVVRRGHTGAVPETPPLARAHYLWIALICAAISLWFARVYPWSRVIGQRAVELMKARAVALATGKASRLIVAPRFAVQAGDTAWVVTAMATIHAKPATEHDAEELRKSLACSLARGAPLTFRGAELDLMAKFDSGSAVTVPAAVYFADLELTPEACNGK